jgi:GTP:adenosylcobinamide-phosphate guanylyltransferase
MVAQGKPFTVVVLAAQRAGVVNPLAQRAGVSHKCLAPIAGKPLIVHVIEAVAGYPGLAAVRVSVEPEVHAALAALLAPFIAQGLVVDLVASSTNIVDSMLAAAAGQASPFLITTADNVLLSRESMGATLAALETDDVVASLATREAVLAVHPEAQRGFYEFRDGHYANCNLYGIAGPQALRAAEVFRGGGQFMKNPKRLIAAFGLINILLVRFRLVSLAGAMKLASRRFKLRFRALVPADGAQAVDVDNERTYRIAEMVLEQRSAG